MAPSSDSGTGGPRTQGRRPRLTLRGHGRWAMPLAFSVAGALVAMTLTGLGSTPTASARPGGSAAGQAQGSTATTRLIRQGKQTFHNSLVPGIGHRLDGWANRDLNVGAIIGFAPNLQPIANLLHTDVATVHKVLNAWGPGHFDAELLLDGKAFEPNGRTAASLIPPAFGLAGVNLHTYTGWGSIPYWNAFVAILEMHGQGTFFDPRLDNAKQFPIAAENHFGHIVANPDLVTPKLPGLHAYQLSLRAPAPPPGSFDPAAAARGKALFNGPAECATCHVPPIFTQPGWNLVPSKAVGIGNFEANRSPTHMLRTTPLAGLWSHQKDGFYHDGRFSTLLAP
jgi:hypothetical protein